MVKKLVRLLYVDESGIGSESAEPITVVAGIGVHADVQLKPLEVYLASLVEKHIHPEDRAGFVFHAKEIFHGGKILTREKYAREDRWKILDDRRRSRGARPSRRSVRQDTTPI